MGTQLRGLLDSGASCTILGRGALAWLNKWRFKPSSIKCAIKTADGSLHTIDHCVDVPYEVKGVCRVVKTLIAPSIPKELILGIDFWDAFGIRPVSCETIIDCSAFEYEGSPEEKDKNINKHILTTDQADRLALTLTSFYVSEPNKLGFTTVMKHRINTGNAEGVRTRARPVSPYVQKDMDKEIDRMLKLGVIEKAEPTDWAHPVVCVRKPNGKLRFCLDARKLNAVTV